MTIVLTSKSPPSIPNTKRVQTSEQQSQDVADGLSSMLLTN